MKLKKNLLQKSSFTFLWLSRPSGYSELFFLALTRKLFTGPFSALTINVTLKFEQSRIRRKNLDTLEL